MSGCPAPAQCITHPAAPLHVTDRAWLAGRTWPRQRLAVLGAALAVLFIVVVDALFLLLAGHNPLMHGSVVVALGGLWAVAGRARVAAFIASGLLLVAGILLAPSTGGYPAVAGLVLLAGALLVEAPP